jgi:hypothetical protein
MPKELSPTTEFFDADGYRYIETSMEWRLACAPLPCFAALWWPGYGTTVIEDTIDGRPVIIQLWKGWCQQFLNLKNMPGGIGGEVGVYRRTPGRRIAEALPDLPLPYVNTIRQKIAGIGEGDLDRELWWPDPDLVTHIELEFINPITQKPVFRIGPEETYWLAAWMDLPSYHKYADAQPGSWPFDKQVPSAAWDYHLKYKINGKTYPIWTDHR